MESALPPLPGSVPSGSDRLLAILCHLSLMFGMGFLFPLIVFLVRNQDSPWVGAHAKEVLNFHITLILYAIVFWVLVFVLIGIPLLILLGVFAFVCAIIGAMRAAENGFYRYPLTLRLF
jgi:uncharacterized Tic20 family protein